MGDGQREDGNAINVLLDGETIPIDRSVFVTLLEDSFASTYVAYDKALSKSTIEFSELVRLARRGQIPYSLFFGTHEMAAAQQKAKIDKLLNGIRKDTYSINSRETVELRQIELIVRDLIRKQELLKISDDTLVKNTIVGVLGRVNKTPAEDAETLLTALGLTRDSIRSAKTKESAFKRLVHCLEANQILVAQSVSNYMPQRLQGVSFSGLTIKDNKVPYIFLAGGAQGEPDEPAGRRIFTLILLTVLVARKIFAPVKYENQTIKSDTNREYDIAGEILVPHSELKTFRLDTLDAVEDAAAEFKVTPSAVAVRGARLGQISWDDAKRYLDELAQAQANRTKTPVTPPKPYNAVAKYAGRAFSSRMLAALDAGRISQGEFLRAVCLNKMDANHLPDFRRAVH